MKNESETITIPATEYAALKEENAELTQKVNWLMEQVRLSKHRQFGASSEKSTPPAEQLSFFNEAEHFADLSKPEPELIEVEKHKRKRTRLTTDKLPEDLPVEIIVHELEASEQICPECNGSLHAMGQDVRRELVIIPAQVKIREHVRKVYSCRNCEHEACHIPIVKTALSEPVIKGSFASAEAIAHIMSQKFVMGTPLYRQEQDWKRRDILFSRQTMSNWLLKATENWLEPIYNDLHHLLIQQEVLHADETTLQVLKEPGKSAQSKSYMWLYRTSGDVRHPIVLYEYQPNRRGVHPQKFLEGFRGYLHTDGYEGYHQLPEPILVVGCFAHLRRKFEDALKMLDPKRVPEESMAYKGKQYCDKLFSLEREIADLSVQERYERRQKLAKPLLDEFYRWVESCHAIPKSGTGIALGYAVSQRKYLERYILDGRLEISNNRAERSIKPFVIDRKNFLFSNTQRGAKASAIMFSLIETAKEEGLDPFTYLTYVFQNAPNWDIKNDSQARSRLLPSAFCELQGSASAL